MNKLDMQTTDIVDENIEKIGELFPNVIVESEKGKAIDFNLLKQELSKVAVDESKEKYQLTWPGKKESIITANTPTTKTLRPVKEKSVDFENTKNIYIEGDNLEVLKILQESYLNKVKCIYIDPPYNTGNDFIYNDKFSKSKEEELEESGQVDEYGNKMVSNPQSNGKYHSDWLSMMYPRIKLARNLLTDDGVIFISIDDNEVDNLKKVCNEIFGENNFICDIIRKTKSTTNDSNVGVNVQHENTLIYSKNNNKCKLYGEEKTFENYKNPDNDLNGEWCSADPSARTGSTFEIINPYTGRVDLPPLNSCWRFSKKSFDEFVKSGKIKFKESHNENERGFIFKRYKNEVKSEYNKIGSLFGVDNKYMNQAATKNINELIPEFKAFDYTKPVNYMFKLLQYSSDKDTIVLDFFSGSGTTAHACMQLNAEDGGNRKYIMVQLPEKCDEKSEAFKAGYKTICEIGQERIRRAANKIKEETKADIDYGFRVYKVDSSNMKDVYYTADEYKQEQLEMFTTNIKEDRNNNDLLTSVILDLGLSLDLKIEEKTILDNKVYFIDENSLVACFDDNINIEIVDNIAKYSPLKVVFRESSFKSDNDKINLMEKMKKILPETEVSVI